MQVWNSVIEPHTSHIYIWDNDTVCIYEWQGCSTKQYQYLQPHTMASFPIGCIPISGHFQVGTFITNGYVKITVPPALQCTTLSDQYLMHHGTQCNTPLPIVAQAIWDGQAILATDGSVKNEIMTYAWIISNTNDNIEQDITSGNLLPPSTPYTHHASK